jgi:hypothetical protein
MPKSLKIAFGPFSPCSLVRHSFLPRIHPLPLGDGVRVWDSLGSWWLVMPCIRGIGIYTGKPLAGTVTHMVVCGYNHTLYNMLTLILYHLDK